MEKKDRRSKPEYQIKIAKERINILIKKSINIYRERPDLSRRYFQLARKIGMRYNVRIPSSLKRRFCKECYTLLTSGWRMKKGKMYNVCKKCGATMRYPYKPKRQKITPQNLYRNTPNI